MKVHMAINKESVTSHAKTILTDIHSLAVYQPFKNDMRLFERP